MLCSFEIIHLILNSNSDEPLTGFLIKTIFKSYKNSTHFSLEWHYLEIYREKTAFSITFIFANKPIKLGYLSWQNDLLCRILYYWKLGI